MAYPKAEGEEEGLGVAGLRGKEDWEPASDAMWLACARAPPVVLDRRKEMRQLA